ncbi:hypothetical protein O3P69_003625 [Scylla paramamosain]|uniref:Uncharacterized protein n=1 Tax=Scylla paramamosain TaxID=85552 RepID=A0AAW0UJV0_SCYPA
MIVGSRTARTVSINDCTWPSTRLQRYHGHHKKAAQLCSSIYHEIKSVERLASGSSRKQESVMRLQELITKVDLAQTASRN